MNRVWPKEIKWYKDIEQVFFAKLTQRKYEWRRAIFLFVVKNMFLSGLFKRLNYSSWSTSKSKNQLRIRRRMLYLWKLVGCFINYQDLAIHGSLSTICQTFLSLYHLTILWWRGFYHIFLFFEFLKNGCKYRFQIWHACKTNKMPSDQHWYEDINIDFDWEFCKNCFSHD